MLLPGQLQSCKNHSFLCTQQGARTHAVELNDFSCQLGQRRPSLLYTYMQPRELHTCIYSCTHICHITASCICMHLFTHCNIKFCRYVPCTFVISASISTFLHTPSKTVSAHVLRLIIFIILYTVKLVKISQDNNDFITIFKLWLIHVRTYVQ